MQQLLLYKFRRKKSGGTYSERCCKNKNNSFDVFAYLPENKSCDLENNRIEIGFDDIENMFSYLDAKAKNDFLYGIEERIESEKSYSKKLSVVLCTNRISETLKKCMTALCTQNASPEDYEIIFVNNDYKNKEIKEFAQSFGKINPDLVILLHRLRDFHMHETADCGHRPAK